ncbi:hypothetical protein [Synoicihabitans lomoniglobus]|uniref:Uncharacterized protein n=1 Tax=Synoicihabitans lomoniglobus TaxID=2909285 RepID=A0AAF0CGG0_9BACT|nr:hypothetical protein [Opitutaceae bacterium LMO-M01]WED63557.1 hypothetical protein PXH66_14565 [Opitutaceae bacterium LMO-M01]
MHDGFKHALLNNRPTLLRRWETLLRAERVQTPMAHPDTLVHLMDWTLDQLFAEIQHPKLRRHHPKSEGLSGPGQLCVCGQNPLLTYFSTAEQAMIETLLVERANTNRLSAVERDVSLSELKSALHAIARREIDSFCAVCRGRIQQAAKDTASPRH